MEHLLGDVRLALRQFRRAPGFTAAAVLTLALGIGGIATVFGAVHGLLLRPLPLDGADRIVTLWERTEVGAPSAISEPNFEDWATRSRSFEAMALHSNPDFEGPTTILGAETAVRARPTAVAVGFFAVFRIAPEVGRGFVPEDHQAGSLGVVKVSRSFWRHHLGGDPDVVGRTLEFWGEPYTVVGVLPDGFHYPADTDLWLPAERFGRNPNRMAHNWAAVGRLRPGVGVEEANREMETIGAALRAEHGEGTDARGAIVTRLQDALVGDLRQPLLLLLGAAALVLLIACSNLAGALTGRGIGRMREFAIRTAVGARRSRLVRQSFTESFVLAALGAAAGLALMAILGRALLVLAPPRIDPAVLTIDGRLLGFTLAATLATTVFVGLLPALRASGARPGAALRAGRGTAGTRSRAWSLLVAGEVAIALVLLVGSGLLLRSFVEILRTDPGFVAERVLTIDLSLPATRYTTDAEKATYYRTVLDDLRTLPGVERAGLVQHIPFGGVDWSGSFEIDGRGQSEYLGVYAHYRVASDGYFEAMGIPILSGRAFDSQDRPGTLPVAVVNRSLAERIWPGEDPVGKRIRGLANEPAAYQDVWLTVVGVVGDVRHGGHLVEAPPEVYVNVMQRPDRAGAAVVAMRTAVPPATLAGAARERIRAIDPEVPAEVVPMSERMMASLAGMRFVVLVLGVFTAVAVGLAALGIYAIVSYTVASRTREIGVRLALGGEASRVVGWVVRRAAILAGTGLAAGFLLAAAGTRLLGGMLHGVAPLDPLTYSAAAGALILTALVSAYLPARRAARVDPMIALRAE